MTTNRTATASKIWTVTLPDGTIATGGTKRSYAFAVAIQFKTGTFWAGGSWAKMALCATEKSARSQARTEMRLNPNIQAATVVPVVMSEA